MSGQDHLKDTFTYRPALQADIPIVEAIMQASMEKLMSAFLTEDEVQASYELMGLDTELIADGTYYLVLEGEIVVGCGGWSRRQTLYGGNHTAGRDSKPLIPGKDAARIRAMYTHPDHVRKGIGRLIIDICEQEAKREGFNRFELMATMPGVPLYEACGYETVEEEVAMTSKDVRVPLRRMAKQKAA